MDGKVAKIIVVFGSLALFGVLTWLRSADFGTLVGFSFAAIFSAAWVTRYLSCHWYYWAVLAVATGIHIVIALSVHIHMPHPTILMAPVVTFDCFLIIVFMHVSNKVFDRSNDTAGK